MEEKCKLINKILSWGLFDCPDYTITRVYMENNRFTTDITNNSDRYIDLISVQYRLMLMFNIPGQILIPRIKEKCGFSTYTY